MKRTATFVVATGIAVALVSGPPVTAQQGQTTTPKTTTDQTQLSDRDEDFLKDVAQSSQVEIDASKLAITKASNAEVKAFAEKLVKDHTAASEELAALVDAKGVQLPPDDPNLKSKKQKHESLQTLTGAAFDKEYLEDMINDHESAMARFGRENTYGKDAAIKAFAEKTLPTLNEHLKMARDLRAKIGK